MRVSNNQILQSSVQAMQQQGADVLKYQQQISSGNRFSKASEGAVELARGIAIQFEQKHAELLKSNQDVVELRMGMAYTTLDTMSSLLMNLKEMAARATYPGLDLTGLKALHAEAQVAYDSFVSAAASQDAGGQQYLFDETTNPIDNLLIEPGVSVPEAIGYTETVGLALAPGSKPTGMPGTGKGPDGTAYTDYAAAGLRKQIANVKFFVDSIDKMKTPGTPEGAAALDEAITQVLTVRTRAGSLSAQVDIARSSLEAKGIELDGARARLLETDVADASTKLVRAQTLLQAAQSIFSRLESSNLFQRLG